MGDISPLSTASTSASRPKTRLFLRGWTCRQPLSIVVYRWGVGVEHAYGARDDLETTYHLKYILVMDD